jgi:hypothetical protein
MIALFFFYKSFGGGTTSFTVHLFEAMRRAGFQPAIFRVGAKGSDIERPFSKYKGVTYRKVSTEDALRIVRNNPSLMTAPCNSKYLDFDPGIIGKLINAGMRCVVHDPNEFEIYDHLNSKVVAPIMIRPTMKRYFKDGVFIPHPYVKHFEELPPAKRKHLAVSVARVTFVKRTEIILAANKLLPKRDQVVLCGGENRLFTKHKVMKLFPEYKQGNTGFPMGWGTAAEECAKGKFAVDMTYFPNDGGGSQYSFMEAWDAGAVNIIPHDWLRYPGEMKNGINCIAVGGARELAKALKEGRTKDVAHLVEAGRRMLETHHDPVRIAWMYKQELDKWLTGKSRPSRSKSSSSKAAKSGVTGAA